MSDELGDEYNQMMAELKKKKKPSKKRAEGDNTTGTAGGDSSEVTEKKKSKKKPAPTTDDANEEKEIKIEEEKSADAPEINKNSPTKSDDDDDDDDDDDGSDTDKKKKKKQAVSETTGDGPNAKMGKYSYKELLQLLYENLRANNPDLVSRKKVVLPPPQVQKGPTKTVWMNFPDICKIMKREPEHLFRFFLAELGTTGSIDGSGRFTIKGKYEQKIIESLLKRYITGYVSCQSCKNVSTDIVKDATTRMSFMHCKSCGASRAVAAIQKGYVATGKGERAKTRNAA